NRKSYIQSKSPTDRRHSRSFPTRRSSDLAIQGFFDGGGRRLPVMVSATFDKGGRTFVSGQSIEAFVAATEHFPLLSIGMNCALRSAAHTSELQSRENLVCRLLLEQKNAFL